MDEDEIFFEDYDSEEGKEKNFMIWSIFEYIFF